MPRSDLFDLSGRVALVTGGSKGLGKAMAHGFARAGADIAISSRSEAQLDQTLDEIGADTGGRRMRVVADMTKREDVRRLSDSVLKEMGRVDILVNNAGGNTPQAIDAIKDEDWDRILELNLTSIMALTRALVPQMKERSWGRIIHISSVLGLGSKEGRNSYSATKRAVIGLAQASSLDLGPHGITVNCIAPGPIRTDLPMSLLSEEEKEVFAERTALKRWGQPSELAGPALLLASEAGSYITGETIVVDGGVMAHPL